MTTEPTPTVQDIVNTGMPYERVQDVVNGIARGIRYRLDEARPQSDFEYDVRTSLHRIAEALDYLVALSRRGQHQEQCPAGQFGGAKCECKR